MLADIDNNFGDRYRIINYLKNHPVTLEKVLSSLCFLFAALFLVVSIFGIWRHFITTGLCVAVGVMIYEEKPDELNKKMRRE